jgi:hypothetical protein
MAACPYVRERNEELYRKRSNVDVMGRDLSRRFNTDGYRELTQAATATATATETALRRTMQSRKQQSVYPVLR